MRYVRDAPAHALRSPAHTRLGALLFVVLLVGCIRQRPRGFPLYADAELRPDRDAVAVVMGPITTVDGRHVVGLGRAFELLPGCHIVTIGGRTGQVDFQFGGWAASLSPRTYAFRMQGGHTYAIDVEPLSDLGIYPSGRLRVTAYDIDSQGNSAEVIEARTQEQITACQRWKGDVAGS